MLKAANLDRKYPDVYQGIYAPGRRNRLLKGLADKFSPGNESLETVRACGLM